MGWGRRTATVGDNELCRLRNSCISSRLSDRSSPASMRVLTPSLSVVVIGTDRLLLMISLFFILIFMLLRGFVVVSIAITK